MSVTGVVVNADDWGGHDWTTDPIAQALDEGLLSSTSGMVHMPDSARAAAIAREHDHDVGLHLNLTQALEGPDIPAAVRERQARVRALLAGGRLGRARGIILPRHARDVAGAVADQVEEFARLYGRAPNRVDGHEHVHLRLAVHRAAPFRALGAVGVRRPWTPDPAATSGPAAGPGGLRDVALRRQAAARTAVLARTHRLPAVHRSVAEVLDELGGDAATRLRAVREAGTGLVELVAHPSWPEHAAALRGPSHRDLLARVRLVRWRDALAEAASA